MTGPTFDDGPIIPPESTVDFATVEGLIEANHESNATMQRLMNRVQDETRARDRKVEILEKNQRQLRLLSGVGVVAILFLLCMAVLNAYNTTISRRNAERSLRIIDSVNSTNQTLLDCINSRGECGKANAIQQEQILDKVKLYSLTILYCARTNPQQIDPKGDKFLVCVQKLYPTGPELDRKDQ